MSELTRAATPSETTVTVVESEEEHVQQVFNDPHIEAIGLIKEVQHPVGKTVRLVGPPVQYSDSVNAVRLPPPLLGQHTADVLKEILDYSEEKIQELQSSGVVQ